MGIENNPFDAYAARVKILSKDGSPKSYSPKSAEGIELHNIFYYAWEMKQRGSPEEEVQCEAIMETITLKLPGEFQ
ncbi:MAG: hypothetical protein WC511_05120 [Candidatus Pacearchaeota archaeon]